MASGLAREHWYPPRDMAQPRSARAAWAKRWAVASGRNAKQTEASLALALAQAQSAGALDDSALRQALSRAAQGLRFMTAEATAQPTPAWRRQRAELLGLWAEVSRRVLGMTPHHTQLRAALEMHNGHFVQLAPGEGKTLAIGLTAGLYASARRPCHVITANDYLAERDAELMAGLLAWGGHRACAVAPEMSPDELRSAYAADVVYGTGKQFLADHLRDRLVLGGEYSATHRRLWEMKQRDGDPRPVGRGLWAAIVDEADSVLIDEATTPLIISSADDNPLLIEAVLGAKTIFENLREGTDYVVQAEPIPDVRFTEAGKRRIDELAYLLPKFWRQSHRAQGVVSLSVMAKYVYQRDRHYLVDDEGKVVIVDEKTGRVMAGRSWSNGIHQAVEAMEGLELSSPPKTVARMTFQTFFNGYHRLCGASGTLQGIHGELRRTYGSEVVNLQPRVPSQLKHRPRRIFTNREARLKALIDDACEAQAKGQPVLIGTRKILDTERIAQALEARGVAHAVLNAKHHAEEAEIVSRAGQPGAVTVSTNMAGRGTDIGLAPGVAALGGLRVLMFEPHEASRIEWQLFGRAGRQGAPGVAQAYVYVLDELLAHALGPLYVRSVPVVGWLYTQPWLMSAWLKLAQALLQRKAAGQRRRLAEREETVSNQLSFSD
jgi:preprotein translocase subunit SecA